MKSGNSAVWYRASSTPHRQSFLLSRSTLSSRSPVLRRPSLSSHLSSPAMCRGGPSAFTLGGARRLCSTGVAAASSSSSSPSQGPRRRSKRFSYADADRVYAAAEGERPTTEDVTAAAETERTGASASLHFQAPLDAFPPASTSNQREPQHAGLLRRLHTRLQQQRQIVLLTLLRMPYVGALIVRLLEGSAYAAYVKGSVVLFTRMSVSQPITPVVSAAGLPPSNSGNTWPSSPSRSSSLLSPHALECLYIGQSSIHSRGLFTRAALPRGTRIIAEPHRSLLLAPHFLTLLADTHEKLPDTWHYTQPTGSIVELVTQAQPHHLMNHSCRANVCSGLSHAFWGPALLAAEHQSQRRKKRSTSSADVSDETSAVSLHERLTRWANFADANSFFLTRDVDAGEELTLNYSTRMAPMYAGESRQGLHAQGWLLCRCGEPCCRHYVYRPTLEAAALLHQLHTYRGRSKHADPPLPPQPSATAVVDVTDPMQVAAALLELGFDDELVILSYAASASDVVAYLYGQPVASFSSGGGGSCGDGGVALGIDVARRRIAKRDLLMSYRHVFRLLNEAAPVDHLSQLNNDRPVSG
jgi:hypothetical protein